MIFDSLDQSSIGVYYCVAIPNEHAKIGSSRLKIELRSDKKHSNKVQLLFLEYDTDSTALRIGKKGSFDLRSIENEGFSTYKATPKTTPAPLDIRVLALGEQEDENIDLDSKLVDIKHFNSNVNRELKIYLKNPKKSFIQIGDKVEFVCATNRKMKNCKLLFFPVSLKFSN